MKINKKKVKTIGDLIYLLFGALFLFIVLIIVVGLILYFIKSFLGINLFPKHLWEYVNPL